MTNEKKKLIGEIDELQGFINTCEVALDYGLGLDEATYDKYNRAIERQRELGEQLEGMDDSPPWPVYLRTAYEEGTRAARRQMQGRGSG